MAAEFSYREEAGVAWFTVDRPAEQNMLSPEVLAALLERARRLKESREVNVLVVTGADDHPGFDAAADELVAGLPDARRARIEGADHLVAWRKPAELAGLVREFLGA